MDVVSLTCGSKALPLHDHEPRGATVSRLAVIVAGLRLRLIEERERQTLGKQLPNVARKRAMPIFDPDT
jgi:hypothetical protein